VGELHYRVLFGGMDMMEDDDVDVDVGMLPDREADIEPPPPYVESSDPRRLGYNITTSDVARGSYIMHGLFLEGLVPHGHHRAYRKNGTRMYEYVYNNGVPTGSWWDWNHEGKFDALRSFDEDGRPHGTWIEWREDSMFDMYDWKYTTTVWKHGLPCELYKHSFHEVLFWTVPVNVTENQTYYVHIQEDIQYEMSRGRTTTTLTIVCVDELDKRGSQEQRRTNSGTYFYGEMPTFEEKENAFFLHGPGIYDPGRGTLTYRIDCRIVAQWKAVDVKIRGKNVPTKFYESYFVERAAKTFEKEEDRRFTTVDDLIAKTGAFIEEHRMAESDESGETTESDDEEN
jgi:hypothetical protein